MTVGPDTRALRERATSQQGFPTMQKYLLIVLLLTSASAAADPRDAARPHTHAGAPATLNYEGNVIHGREYRLPLCDWTTGSDFHEILSGESGVLWWCQKIPGAPLPRDPWVNNCAWEIDQDLDFMRPANQRYELSPWDQAEWPTYYQLGGADMLIGESKLHNVAGLTCERAASGLRDIVRGVSISGSPYGDYGDPVTVADVHAGVVVHIRPALVRATVVLGHSEDTWGFDDDVVLAVQVEGSSGWSDVATRTYTSMHEPREMSVETYVAPGLDVRLQVRGIIGPWGPGEGFDLREARVFIEECVPDQSNPGSCL